MAGNSDESAPNNDLFVNEWPTEADLEFFDKFAKIEDATDLIRTSSHTLKLPPCRIKLTNLENLPKDQRLDRHVGHLFDIFIRKTIKEAGGNLTETKYWLNLQHPAYVEKDGFWIMHKTYQMANGHTLMNIISKQNQSLEELSLDETLVLSMRIFATDQMTGRGKSVPDQILKKYGLTSPNVIGDTHCMPKALVIGTYWSDYRTTKNPEMYRLYANLTRNDNKIGRGIRQLQEARNLLAQCGMDPNVQSHNIVDLEQIAAHLKDYHIRVWSLLPGRTEPTMMFETNKGAHGFISIFHNDDHYEFFKATWPTVKVRFCFKCHKLVSGRRHRKRCGREQKYCEMCYDLFLTVGSYNAHLKKKHTPHPSHEIQFISENKNPEGETGTEGR